MLQDQQTTAVMDGSNANKAEQNYKKSDREIESHFIKAEYSLYKNWLFSIEFHFNRNSELVFLVVRTLRRFVQNDKCSAFVSERGVTWYKLPLL